MRTCRCQCTRIHASSSGSWWGGRCTSSRYFASAFPRLCRFFTRVMAPVSAILHRMGVRLRRYLDVWLLQASSCEQVLLALRTVLQLCRRLGIVVNWEKSRVIPTQQMIYLGVILDSTAFRAFSCPEERRRSFSQLMTFSCPASVSQCHLGWSY